MKLRNRIIWRFNFGLHSKRRLSGRYETILWFTKSDDHRFNLDAVRVPQLYPGKRHSKKRTKTLRTGPAEKARQKSIGLLGVLGREDFQHDPVWDIPNVKANHPEKTIHPCPFPVELVERCVFALTDPGDTVLDPFMGTGTTAIAAMKHNRNAVGIDKDGAFLKIARKRAKQLSNGTLKTRLSGKATHQPKLSNKVARVPEEWKSAQSAGSDVMAKIGGRKRKRK